ncbi:MAG: response regulator transcription factor [Gammaproteobacteria bacterium]
MEQLHEASPRSKGHLTGSLLLIDDDRAFCQVVGDALTHRGFVVAVAHTVNEGLRQVESSPPKFCLVDLRLPDGSGLAVVRKLSTLVPTPKVVVLTGFASIATAIEATKLGAVNYLAKPVTLSQILAAFRRTKGKATVPLPRKPALFEALEWEYLNQALVACKGNVSATARRLGMHRRTLQRKLSRSPHEA